MINDIRKKYPVKGMSSFMIESEFTNPGDVLNQLKV